MGQTMNHVAAVVVPVAGGLLWHRFNYHAPFWCGVGAALVSLLISPRCVLPRTDSLAGSGSRFLTERTLPDDKTTWHSVRR